MPLAKFVLLLIIVVSAAGLTVAFGTLMAGLLNVSPSMALATFMPLAALAYIVWRVISDRLSNAEDDKYDQIQR